MKRVLNDHSEEYFFAICCDFFLEYLQTTAVFAESLIAHDLDHSAGDQNPQIEGLHEGKAVKLYK